jgi:glycosyltransferase involved in cell wall biosynthesis
MSLSVVITTYNCADVLGGCLRSVSWADELVVVDGGSSDGTIELARKFTDCVYVRPNQRMPNVNKNFGFERAREEWILSLDSDERVTVELAAEIRDLLTSGGGRGDVAGWWIRRVNFFLGYRLRHGPWGNDFQLRLFRRGRGRFACRDVHEYLTVKGRMGRLRGPLHHLWLRSISGQLERIDGYSRLRAERYLKEGRRWSALRMVLGPCRQFVENYVFRLGLLDGPAGLFACLLYSFHSFLDWAKLWELQCCRNKGVHEEKPTQ